MPGALQAVGSGNNGLFMAPLRAGGSIDYGLFLALVGISTTTSYQ